MTANLPPAPDSDDAQPTRTIAAVEIDDIYGSDEQWLVIQAAGDTWPVMWDQEYANDLITALLRHYGLDYDEDPEAVDIEQLVAKELPVRENEYGDWEAVRSDVFREVDG